MLSKDNRVLFIGKVIEADESAKTIKLVNYRGGDVPWTSIVSGTCIRVLVRREPYSGKILLMSGEITLSVNEFLKMHVDLVIEKDEKRNCFRQNVLQESVFISPDNLQKEIPCTIMDISLTGIRLSCEEEFSKGDQIIIPRLKLKNGGKYTHYLQCRILRCSRQGENIRFYGCKFLGLSDRDEEKLLRDIFALQSQEIRSNES